MTTKRNAVSPVPDRKSQIEFEDRELYDLSRIPDECVEDAVTAGRVDLREERWVEGPLVPPVAAVNEPFAFWRLTYRQAAKNIR